LSTAKFNVSANTPSSVAPSPKKLTTIALARRSHHGGHSHYAGFGIDEVHRSALASGTSGGFPVKFGDHRFHVAALGEVKGVAAVSAEDDILRLQCAAYAHGYGFLSDGEMNGALDYVGRVDSRDLLFQPADAVQRSIQSREHELS
jgi:hypothetical protein